MPPLSHGNLERVIGTALIDREFRGSLLRSPADATSGFDLSEEELAVLSSANAASLEELASHVHAWLTRAPKPKRVTTPRWPLQGYEAVQVAV